MNIRQKGQGGEREVASMLNKIVRDVRIKLGLAPHETRNELFQRNQNQSAVGGSDLSNPLYLEIEVKRQEQLSVNSWWKQCVESADRTGGIPILVFRQNRKKWRVCMLADIPLQPSGAGRYSTLGPCRVEVDIETFLKWFRTYYDVWASANG
jgi:Holliday junction resolvase